MQVRILPGFSPVVQRQNTSTYPDRLFPDRLKLADKPDSPRHNSGLRWLERKRMQFTIRNGTPQGNEPLCKTCVWVHMQTGFRESEELMHCSYDRLRLIPFPVKTCTDYTNRTHPSWEEMQKLALPVEPKSTRAVRGFGVEETPEIEKS